MTRLIFIVFAVFMSGCMAAHEHNHTWEDGTTTNYKSIGGTHLMTGGTTRDTYTDCDADGKHCREQIETVKNTSLVGQLGGMGEAGILRDGGLGKDNINNSSESSSSAKSRSLSSSSSGDNDDH